MLCVLKRTVSMRRFFWASKTYVKTDGQENIYNFTLKNFVYLNLWTLETELNFYADLNEYVWPDPYVCSRPFQLPLDSEIFLKR